MTLTAPTAPALVLAAWWAGFLTRTAPQDHGDDSDVGELTTTLMLILAAHDRHTPEEAVRFETALAQQFQAQLDRHGSCEAWTDYRPSSVLCVAATLARISLSDVSLPIKSSSAGSADQVKVKQGYRGEWRSIWTLHSNITRSPLASNSSQNVAEGQPAFP